ncbi:MAG: WGxxGxxG family protein [Crinalium sp.]
MKTSNLSKIAGATLLAISFSVLPSHLPASAQNNSTTTENNRPVVDTTPFQENPNDHNNWGWLGLLGLIGLANLFRKDEHHVHRHESDTVSGTTTRL